ncbi:MAG TPA: TIGR00730 family Rossman fold protein, partial [Phycisphaerales bacterium]|nr:TIGR00730 family Rossman fold protein [Phycisphaerales bacterium]
MSVASVAVFCSARDGLDRGFVEAARAIGRGLAGAGVAVVYGGGGAGLMGEVADAALGAGGEVVGVIPRSMVEQERAHTGLDELIVVETM